MVLVEESMMIRTGSLKKSIRNIRDVLEKRANNVWIR